MNLRIFSLNTYGGLRLTKIVSYLQKQQYDIVALQEVVGKDTHFSIIDRDTDCFSTLQKGLGKTYLGELAISDTFTSSPTSYMGVAIFYKSKLQLKKKEVLWLNKNEQPFLSTSESYDKMGKNALILSFKFGEKEFSVVTTHLAWAPKPIEQPYQKEQNNKLIARIAKLTSPFVLTGDFNLTSDQPTLQILNNYANNLTTQYHIANTLNPKLHRAKELFPKGHAVDYIMTSPEIKVIDCKLITEELSDHFGLTTTIEL